MLSFWNSGQLTPEAPSLLPPPASISVYLIYVCVFSFQFGQYVSLILGSFIRHLEYPTFLQGQTGLGRRGLKEAEGKSRPLALAGGDMRLDYDMMYMFWMALEAQE